MKTAIEKVLSFVVVFVLSGSAFSADSPPTKTPGEAAKTFYETLNTGVQADIEKLMSKASLAAERALPPDIQKMRRRAAEIATKYHSLIKVDVLKENIQETRAWVDVRLHYKDGTSQQFNCGFINEGGEWKTTDN